MWSMVKFSVVGFSLVAAGIQILGSPIERDQHRSKAARFTAAMSPEVGAILMRSCKDCHSNETTWPWYSQIAPVSWIVASDVKKGREKLNFSDWGSRERSANEVEEICDAARNGSMPLRGYRLMHPEASLSEHDVDSLCRWADLVRARTQKGVDEGARTSLGPQVGSVAQGTGGY